jgi:hypothetical protein
VLVVHPRRAALLQACSATRPTTARTRNCCSARSASGTSVDPSPGALCSGWMRRREGSSARLVVAPSAVCGLGLARGLHKRPPDPALGVHVGYGPSAVYAPVPARVRRSSRACLPAYLLVCLLAGSLACLPACLPACVSALVRVAACVGARHAAHAMRCYSCAVRAECLSRRRSFLTGAGRAASRASLRKWRGSLFFGGRGP